MAKVTSVLMVLNSGEVLTYSVKKPIEELTLGFNVANVFVISFSPGESRVIPKASIWGYTLVEDEFDVETI